MKHLLNPNDPVVYVLHDDGTKNLFPAKEFGQITTFTRKELPMFDTSWVADLCEWLALFNPEKDHLLLVGDPTLIGMACAVIARDYRHIPLLKWDRQERRYINNTYTVPPNATINQER